MTISRMQMCKQTIVIEEKLAKTENRQMLMIITLDMGQRDDSLKGPAQ